MIASKKRQIVIGDYFLLKKHFKKWLMTIAYELNIEKVVLTTSPFAQV